MRQITVIQSIKKGLSSLLTKKRYMDITITNLIMEAKVSRASFYRYFSSLDDVLQLMVSDFADALSSRVVPVLLANNDKNKIAMAESYLKRIKNNEKTFLTHLPENRELLIAKFEKEMFKSNDVLGADVATRYSLVASLSILFGVATAWINGDCDDDPHDLAVYIVSLLPK